MTTSPLPKSVILFTKIREILKMNASKKLFLSLLVVTFFSACATKKIDQKVDSALAQTPPVSGPAQLQKDATNTIASTPGISDDQRAKLVTIQKATETKLGDLREQSLKMRELLIQEVVRTENYNDNEVNRIKSRLKKVESKRLDTLFKALDQANDVLGHQTQRTQVMNSMMRMDNYDNRFSGTRP
jgi:hypothetical protein